MLSHISYKSSWQGTNVQPLKLFIVTEALNFKSGTALVHEVQDLYFKKQQELDTEL